MGYRKQNLAQKVTSTVCIGMEARVRRKNVTLCQRGLTASAIGRAASEGVIREFVGRRQLWLGYPAIPLYPDV